MVQLPNMKYRKYPDIFSKDNLLTSTNMFGIGTFEGFCRHNANNWHQESFEKRPQRGHRFNPCLRRQNCTVRVSELCAPPIQSIQLQGQFPPPGMGCCPCQHRCPRLLWRLLPGRHDPPGRRHPGQQRHSHRHPRGPKDMAQPQVAVRHISWAWPDLHQLADVSPTQALKQESSVHYGKVLQDCRQCHWHGKKIYFIFSWIFIHWFDKIDLSYWIFTVHTHQSHLGISTFISNFSN